MTISYYLLARIIQQTCNPINAITIFDKYIAQNDHEDKNFIFSEPIVETYRTL